MQIPQENHVKYLGLYLDRHITWHTHIFAKRKQLGLALTKMYWLLGRKSELSTNNKLVVYKAVLKPIWTYGIQLWGTTSNSNIKILMGYYFSINATCCVDGKIITHLSPRNRMHPTHLKIKILERFQSKVLRLIVDAPWYVSNYIIRKDLQIPTVKEEISCFSSLYAVLLRAHTNELIATLTEPPIHKCLR
jgi:hypothetical protein